jgi:hypothetical protein
VIVKELFARLGLTVDEGGFSKAKTALGSVRTAVLGLGAVLGAVKVGIEAMVKHTAETADHLDDLSQSTGISSKTLQELAYAGQFANLSLDDLAGGMKFLSKHAYEASTGNASASATFQELGIAVRDAAGQLKTPEQLLNDVADAMVRLPDGAKKSALAMEVMGRAGTGLIPFLNMGSGGLAKMAKEAHATGNVMSKRTLEDGQRLADDFDRLTLAAKGLSQTIAGPLLKPMARTVETLVQWVTSNRKLIAGGAVAFANAFGAAMRAVVQVVGGAASLLGELLVKSEGFAVILGVVGAAALLAFFPITAAIGGLLLLLEDVYGYMHGKRSLIGFLKEKLSGAMHDMLEDPITFWKTQLEEFADWFGRMIGGKFSRALDNLFGAAPRPAPGQQVIGAQPPDSATGFSNFMSNLFGPPPGPTPVLAGAAGGAVHNWVINAPGGDPQAIKQAVDQVLQTHFNNADAQLGPVR